MKTEKNRHGNDNQKQPAKANATSRDFEQVAKEAKKQERRKPGSQSNSSKQHNNGRGGGK